MLRGNLGLRMLERAGLDGVVHCCCFAGIVVAVVGSGSGWRGRFGMSARGCTRVCETGRCASVSWRIGYERMPGTYVAGRDEREGEHRFEERMEGAALNFSRRQCTDHI